MEVNRLYEFRLQTNNLSVYVQSVWKLIKVSQDLPLYG